MNFAKKLVIGGAQFGIPSYGINNHQVLEINEIAEILEAASCCKIEYIDTAREYGKSEEVLGKILKKSNSKIKIISKLSALSSLKYNVDHNQIREKVIDSVNKSAEMLNMPIDILMLHRADHFWKWDGIVWDTLLSLKNEGYFKNLGVSIQTPHELDILLQESSISIFQLPYNLLDWRWMPLVDKISQEKNKRDLLIHTRSSLLQGLLVSENISSWQKANCLNPDLFIEWLKKTSQELGRSSIVDLSLAFIKSHNWIDGVVVGVDNKKQFLNNVELFKERGLTSSELDKIYYTMPKLSENTLNPSKWRNN